MKSIRFATLLLATSLIPIVGYGQSRGGSSSSGFGGGSTFGSNGVSSGGAGSSSFGRGGSGGGFGSSGLGGGFGGMGFGGMGGGGMGGGLGSTGGQMGMIFDNNQSFVGSDSDQIRQSLQQMGRNSDRMAESIDRATRRRDRDRDNNGENAPPPVRVKLRVAFDHPAIGSAAVPATITQRLATIVAAKEIAMPDVAYSDGVVTLTGVAPTSSDRLLIEKLVSMEPGVKGVVNQMTVPEAIDVPIPPQ